MLIRFDEIPAEGLTFEVKEQSWFPVHDLQHVGPVRATVTLEREGDRVAMAGSLEATVLMPCARCLELCQFHLQSAFKLNLEVADPSASSAAPTDHLCHLDEMDTIELEQPVVDIADLLAQQLYLALPVKHLCRRSCRGLCPVCGGDLNREPPCGCGRQDSESPFAALGNLKLKKD